MSKHGDQEQQRPSCAVKGVLYGGRAMCGSVIVGDKACGFDGPCQYKEQPSDEKDHSHE